MNLLFDIRWVELSPDEVADGRDVTATDVSKFLTPDDAADRIAAALTRSRVWAGVDYLGDHDLPVQDVRVLHEGAYNSQNFFIETGRKMQVLLAEGWKLPSRVWSDEPEILDSVE